TIQSDDPRARLAQEESTIPDVRPPVRRVETRDGRQVYVDEFGRTIQAGARASRHESERPVQKRWSATTIQSDDPRARLAQDESTIPYVRPPVRRVETRDGRQVYVDEFGRTIQAGARASRHESERPLQKRCSAPTIQSDDPRARLAQDESTVPDVRPPMG